MPKTNIGSTCGHLYVTIMAVTKVLVVQMILNALPLKKTSEDKRFSEKKTYFCKRIEATLSVHIRIK